MKIRYAIIADIHANLEAIEAVLKDIKEQHCTHFACLGDVVGYNANPKECLDMIRDMDMPCVKGNHDELACMSIAPSNVSGLANEGIAYTRSQLTPEELKWLNDLIAAERVAQGRAEQQP